MFYASILVRNDENKDYQSVKDTRDMMIRGKVYRFPHIVDLTKHAHSRQGLTFRLLNFINFLAKV